MNIVRCAQAIARRTNAGIGAFSRAFFGIEHARSSYSQYGEDTVLHAIFARYPGDYSGFYVDVGAHHPKRYSNTNHFYQLGWRGICIDPVPGGARLFKQQRMKDIFLEVGVSEKEEEMTYYMYEEPGFNTFSEESTRNLPFQWLQTKQVRTMPLWRVLELHLPQGQVIDFLSIDAEGMDMQVLRSNDWSCYRPKIVMTEALEIGSIDTVAGLKEDKFMRSNDYQAIARTPSALYFVDTTSPCFDGGPFLNCVQGFRH